MLAASRDRILATLPDTAGVLDVGGWAVPFSRADHVLDLGAYETRAGWGHDGDPAAERFTADTWTRRDVCEHTPWPYADDAFDFAICSHTLEDLRDPIWVCAELSRVARAGYVEVPSRLEEQTWGFQGQWTGWSHHHWLIDADQGAGRLDFVFKHHVVHDPRFRLPTAFRDTLDDAARVTTLWWERAIDARERIFDSAEALNAYLSEVVERHAPGGDPPPGRRPRGLRRRA